VMTPSNTSEAAHSAASLANHNVGFKVSAAGGSKAGMAAGAVGGLAAGAVLTNADDVKHGAAIVTDTIGAVSAIKDLAAGSTRAISPGIGSSLTVWDGVNNVIDNNPNNQGLGYTKIGLGALGIVGAITIGVVSAPLVVTLGGAALVVSSLGTFGTTLYEIRRRNKN
jgi:hypothetical protein